MKNKANLAKNREKVIFSCFASFSMFTCHRKSSHLETPSSGRMSYKDKGGFAVPESYKYWESGVATNLRLLVHNIYIKY